MRGATCTSPMSTACGDCPASATPTSAVITSGFSAHGSRARAVRSQLTALMEIKIVEVAQCHQPFRITERDDELAELEHPVAPQRLHHPVDVNRGEPQGVGEIRLRHRQLELAVADRKSTRLNSSHTDIS